ncbi:MAG TPA: hypothetical protein VM680_20455 [Verrucomicrobiae bacterium]|nr:hypothetical protein [Verrucomicrobiae bacterium]
MTLAQAEEITSALPTVIASRGSSEFCRRSQLGNWSMVEIAKAFALVIAQNRQTVSADPNARTLCKQYADRAAALLTSLRMIVIPDAEADRLAPLDRNSAEYDEARRRLVITLLQDRSPEWQRFLKLETLDSFNNYCWTLDATDPQYGQKIHDRLQIDGSTRAKEPSSDLAVTDRSN